VWKLPPFADACSHVSNIATSMQRDSVGIMALLSYGIAMSKPTLTPSDCSQAR